MEIQYFWKEGNGAAKFGKPIDEGAVRFVVAVGVASLASVACLGNVVARGGAAKGEGWGLTFAPAAVYHICAAGCRFHHVEDEVFVVGVVVVEPRGVFRCRQVKPLGPLVVAPVVEVGLFVEPDPRELLPDAPKINLRTERNNLIGLLGLLPQGFQGTNKVRRVRMSSYHYGDARH